MSYPEYSSAIKQKEFYCFGSDRRNVTSLRNPHAKLQNETDEVLAKYLERHLGSAYAQLNTRHEHVDFRHRLTTKPLLDA